MEKKEIFKKVKNEYEVKLCQPFNSIEDRMRAFGHKEVKSNHQAKWRFKENYLNSQEKFVEHFADKMAFVRHLCVTAVLEKSDEKISMKFFINEKIRYPGVHWFKKDRNMTFLTLNLKTGILYNGYIIGLHNKKPKKKIITNNFYGSITNVFELIEYHFKFADVNTTNPRAFINFLKSLFVEQIPDWPFSDMQEKNAGYELKGEKFHQYYLMKKGVKIPDNFYLFRGYDFNVKSNFLRKAKNKYVDALMMSKNLSGDTFRKLFHQAESTPTLETLKFVIELVGKTRLEQNYDVLKFYSFHGTNVHNHHDCSILTEQERKNAWLILVESAKQKQRASLVNVRDHINFIGFLRKKGLNYRWKAKNILEFNQEHKMLSDVYDAIKNGVTHRVYPEQYYQHFSQPIVVDGVSYKVQILDKQSEFYRESDYQQNCVKTYIARPGSFIVSIRGGKERATVEYVIRNSKKEWHITRLQYLGRFNKSLPSSWFPILNAVDNMVTDMISEYGYKMTLHKEKNGKTKIHDIDFTEKGVPIWKDPLELLVEDDYFF